MPSLQQFTPLLGATTRSRLTIYSRHLWSSKTSLRSTKTFHNTSVTMGSIENTSTESNGGNVHNAWIGTKGPGCWDMRSDVMTTPTPSMLSAIQACTLLDDVFGEDPTTMDLEAHVAALAGKEAGMFVTSGTQGNQIALRSLLTQPPHGVLCDHRSHIVNYEAGGVSSLTGASVKTVVPKNGIHLTLEDIKANVVLGDDLHDCPTRVISLENTLNGMIMPLEEVQKISEFAKQHNIKMHCDGARLWEAVAAGAAPTLSSYASHFETLSLCFSKGLGAPIGSIIVGPASTLKHCRWVRKSIGGGMRQPGVITAAARVAVDETFGKNPNGQEGWLRASHDFAKKVEARWTKLGGTLVHPAHTNMCWLDLKAAGCSGPRFVELCKEVGLRVMSGRLVTHYQIAQNGDEVLRRLEGVFEKVFSESQEEKREAKAGEGSMYRTE